MDSMTTLIPLVSSSVFDYLNGTTVYFDEITTNFSSSNDTHFVDIQEEDGGRKYTYTQLIQVIARPILVFLGTISNVFVFFVMQKGSLKKVSTCFYIAILALADTGELLFCSYYLSYQVSHIF